MPLDDTDYASASDYHDAIDRESGITPVTQRYSGQTSTASYRAPIAPPPVPSARVFTPYQRPPRAPQITADDKSEDDPTREAFTFRPEEGTPEHGTYMSDYGKAMWNGARQMGSDLMGALDITTRKLSEDPTAQTIFRRAQQSLEHDIENSVASMSPAAQKAYHTSLFSNDPNAPSIDSTGDFARYAGINIAAQVPMLLSFLIPSTIGAKVFVAAAKGMGAAERAIAAATAAGKSAEEIAAAGRLAGTAKLGSTAATGGFFGAQNAGAVYNDIVKQVTDASDKEMMKAPGYAAYREQGMSVTEAKEQIIQKLAGFSVATAGLVGTVAGAGVGGIVRRGALGAVESRVANAGIGAAEGGVLMGGQGAANEALSQRTGQQLGTQQGYDIGKIIAGAVSAGIPGALFGAAGGVFHRPEKGIEDTRGTGGVAPDVRAATEAALGTQGELDLSAAPSGIPVGQQQGELFRTQQEANPPLGKNATSPPMTGAPAPPPPPSTLPGGTGMPGAKQGELPINQTPPGIVPTTGQGEMFPSVPQMNPPRPDATVAPPVQPPVVAGPVGGTVATGPTVGAAPVRREPTGAAAPGTRAGPVDVKQLPAFGKKRDEMIDELVGLTGRKPSSFKGQTTTQIAAVYNREMARQGAGTGAAVESTPPPAKLAGAKPIEEALPAVESKPVAEAPVGELPLPDQPGGALSPQAAVASAVEPVSAKGEVPAEAAPQPAATGGFTTEKGSTYQVHEDGTTTRDKAFRPEHGEAEQGPQPRSQHTFYVSPEDAQKLGEFQTRGGGDKVLAPIGDGRWGVKYTSGKDAGKVEARTVVTPKAHPEAGAIPVELWNNGERVHFGNKITELHEPVTPGVKPEPEAKMAALQTKAGIEQAVEEKPPAPVKAPKTAKAVAVSKRAAEKARMQATGAEVKPVDPEAAVKAQATRDEALKEAEASRKQAATEQALALKAAKAAEPRREVPIRTQDYGAKQEARPDTTDRERIQGELVDRIARGEISGADAHAEYEQGRRKGGRQRREEFDTVAKGIERELAVAQNKDVELALLKQQQEHEANPKGTPKQKEKRTNDLEEQLKHFDPTRIARLQDALKEINDPVGHAADRASPLESTRGPKPAGIDPMGSRFLRVLKDPRLGGGIIRAIQKAHKDGIPLTLHSLLRQVTNDPLLRNEARPMVALAERFLKISPDIPVFSDQHAHDLGHIDTHTLLRMERGGLGGHYHPVHDHIVLSTHYPEDVLGTALHETSHSITTKLINHLLTTDRQHRYLRALDAIHTELVNAYNAAKHNMLPEARVIVEHAIRTDRAPHVAFHELHTALQTEPHMQAFAAARVASSEFREKMRELGYDLKPQRSVWQAFTQWMRKALGMPEFTSGSEATIFDHIIRPVSDITEHAAQYNERTRPRDAALERHAAPLERASRDFLRDTGRSAWDRISASNLPDHLRRMVVGATNVDAIERHNPWLSGLTNYRQVRDKIARTNADAAERYGDRSRKLIDQWGRLRDQKETGQLMNHASINEFHLGDNLAADANKHITDPGDLKELAAAQARFDKLSPEAKDFYGKARDLYKEFYKDTRDAELTGSLRSVIPDITPAQEEEFVKAARNNTTLAKFMDDPDSSDIAKAFGTEWRKNRDLSKIVARSHSYGYTKGDYFPQRRYGKYVVRYGEDEKGGVEFFDKRWKAEARRKELIAQYGPKDVWQVSQHNQKFTREILANHPAVAELETAMTNKGFTDAQSEHARDILASILVNHMANSAAQKTRLKRQGIMGADINHGRVLANEAVNHFNRQGYLLHGAERQAALTNLWSQQHDFERPIGGDAKLARSARDIIQSLEKRQTRPEEMNNVAQRHGATVTAINYAMQLMSPSHMVTSSMESHTNSIALIGGRHGVFKATAAVARNLARAAPVLGKLVRGTKNDPAALLASLKHELQSSNWNVLDMLTKRFEGMPGANKAHIQALHKMLMESGLVDHTMMNDLRRMMNPEGMFGGKVASAWERVADTNAIMAHYVDAINRYVSAKSAFDLELKKNKGDVKGAIAYSEKIARQVAPNYMAGNRELLTSSSGPLGALGAPLMQFKRYGLHMYAMMATLAKESMRAGTSAERWEARKSLALLMGTHAMMAGVMGLPTTDAIRYIMGASDLLHGRDPHNYENDMRRAIAGVFGNTAGELISRGLPHALGFDVHRRVSLNNLLEMPELSSFGKKGMGELLMHLVTGATGDNLTTLMDGATKLLQGDFGDAAKSLLPRIVRDPLKAIQLASQGVVDSRGHTILPAAKLSPYDIGLQAVGFQPSRVSETREGRNAVLEARTEQGAERSKLEQRWLSGNASDRSAAWQAIVEYNSRNPTARITRQQLLQQQQAEKRSGATFGLRLPKKSAASLMQAGSFANVP